MDDRLENILDPVSHLRGTGNGLERIQPQVFVDLLARTIHIRRGEVDLVDHRHDLQVVLQRQVQVRDGLCLDTLGGVDDEQSPFARHQRAAHLVGKIDVAGRVDQVELVRLTVPGLVVERHRIALDRDAPLALDIHRVEDLIPELTVFYRATGLDQAIRKRRFTVIDVGDNAEIASLFHVASLPLGPSGLKVYRHRGHD